ncbi:haloacid dehalogenase, type II [Exophiala aquamarina CBS 119918]|uniref:Haloacid dehalogenase, type II n=1 Tax=Exophiala aquamarina CBS 119918 TaxID=1182545 RepID=A0A072PMR3_9EURO|nr:haloacid dehalogenase, type II [Exophiala aquamarina CBS 119918]KEF61359.1 haloacid dehalogenase, type II [Exophiala aquamarina CBS 119918]
MSVSATTATPGWRPKAMVFDLLTALLDSWTLWDASTPSGSSAEGRLWRLRYLELTFGAGAYIPYESLVSNSARDVGLPESVATTLVRDWETMAAWPETVEVLQRLKASGYRLGVVTNCSKQLGHAASCKAGTENFDAVVTAEESGFYKPVEQAYQAVLVAMGLDACDVLFVAGSAGDVEGATNAGMKVVWHNRVGLPKKGDAVPLVEATTLDDALRDFL